MISMFALWAGFSGCASHAKPVAPIAAAPVASSGVPQVFGSPQSAQQLPIAPPQEGFGGVACGGPPLPNMKLVRTAGDVTFYSNPTAPMQLEQGRLASETYRFYRSEFEGALLETNDSTSSRALLVHMRALIGPGKIDNPVGPVYSWTDSNLDVTYERVAGGADASVVVGCIQVQARHKADMAAAGTQR